MRYESQFKKQVPELVLSKINLQDLILYAVFFLLLLTAACVKKMAGFDGQ